jgi:hypothetical protein
MTFLNPFVLIGLITAAIPLILHLLNLRKLRKIEFSTLAFLKELQQTKIRRLKLKQLLLLIIRTLMIIFIVLTFSRPALQGTILGGIGSHAYSTIIIVLDDSFSMLARDEEGELFKQAKTSATKILELLNDGDEAYIIKLSNPEDVEPIPSHDFNVLKTAIIESKLSLIRNPLQSALRLSAKVISQSKNANKEIYFISDFQNTLFTEEIKKSSSIISLFEQDVKFFLMNIGTKESQNTSIDSLTVETKILEKDKSITFNATIRNYSDKQLMNFVTSLYLEGVRLNQTSLDIDAWETSQISMTVIPKHSGFNKGYLELENDAIEPDNRRYFTLFIPQKLKTIIVSSASNDSKFIRLALKAGSAENSDSLFNITEIQPAHLSIVDLNRADILVLTSINNLSFADFNKIKFFVKLGGGLVIFPDKEFSIERCNNFLSYLEIPPVESLLKTSQDAGISFQKIDFDHPLFSGVFKEVKKEAEYNLESPIIFSATKRQTGKLAHPIITMSNGNPFLTDQKLGDGRILFYSVAPVLSWSNFPLKGIFAPLIYRSLIYVSSAQENQNSFIVGQEAETKLKSVQINQPKWKLILPDGTEEFLKITPGTNGSNRSELLSIGKLTMSGVYQLSDGIKAISLITSNVDGSESDTRKIADVELSTYLEKYGIKLSSVTKLEPNDKIHESILSSRYGIELWKYAIVLVLILALIEMLIARDRKEKVVK